MNVRTRFDKDKYVWLPTDEDCYLPVKVIKGFDKGEEGVVTSAVSKKEQPINVSREASSRCFLMNEESLKIVADMINLQDLNEASILNNLRMRFKRDKIYTHIGKVLVSVNPFKLTKLYTPDVLEDFKLHGRRDAVPHVYGVASDAYNSLLSDRKSQVCLISGESGSGKTEATKLFLQYIAEMSGGMRSLKEIQRGEEAPLQEQILRANPLLEAFGNAKTLRNDNSSRFGKWINILFNRKGAVTNASITNYLLEKTRIVRHSPGERSYHIFYQLIAGCKADPALKEKCKLGDINDYNYLKASRIHHQHHHARVASSAGYIEEDDNDDSDDDDVVKQEETGATADEHDFEYVRTSMDVLNMTTKDKNEVFRTVAAILHLGNIRFSAIQQRNQEDSSKVSNTDVLDLVAKQLGLDTEALGKALVTRTIGGRSGSVVVINLKPSDAVQSRDSLAKAIYSYLFDWLTRSINKSLSKKAETKLPPTPTTTLMTGTITSGATSATATPNSVLIIKDDAMNKCSIGILDIYGFESLDQNSFEQLCINYCNEKLQNYFNEHIFRLEQTQYAEEGIKVPTIDYLNNDGCVTLLEGKPLGIFAMLDDEVSVAGGTDLSFLNKLLTSAPGYGCLEKPGPKVRNAQTCFIVIHYAGKVLYDTYTFLDKNKDVIPGDMITLCKSSSIPFIASIFDPNLSGDLIASTPSFNTLSSESISSSSVTGFVRRTSLRITNAVTSTFKKTTTTNGNSQQQQQIKKTLATQFREQLNDLINMLRGMDPHFIRCIKPNSRSQADSFTSPMVLRQLQNAGILEVARIRKNGYPYHLKFNDFSFSYKPLFPSSKTVQDLVNELVKANIISGQGICVGKSKVFMKYSELEKLQERRNEFLKSSVIKIQSVGRKFVQRKKYKGHLKLIEDIHHCLIARDEKDLDNLLTEAGELPNFGRHIDIVESARKLQKRFIEERRVMDLLQAAVARHDLSSLMSGLAAARRMKLSNPNADTIIEAAQRAVEKIQDMKQLRVELSTAIDSNDTKNLVHAINHANSLEASNLEECRHAQALLERLEGELSIEKEMETVSKSKDIEKILATLKKAASLGFDHTPLAEKLRSARSEIRGEQQIIKLLGILAELRSLPELKAAIAKAELAKIPQEALKEAKDLKKALEKEDGIIRDIASSVTKKDTRGLQIAIGKAESAGLGNISLVIEGKSYLRKAEGREKCEAQLATSIKAKDPISAGIIGGLINAANLGMTSMPIYSAAQAALKKVSKSASDVVNKICEAINAGDADTLEVLLTRAKSSGIAESNFEGAIEISKRMAEENKVVNELYEAMALGDLKRLTAGLDKTNLFDDFASRNHIAYEKAKAVLKATKLAVVALKSEDLGMLGDALAAAKSAGAQEEGTIAVCIKLHASLLSEANVVKTLISALEAANSHRLAAGPPGDISSQHDGDAVANQIHADINNLRTLLERVPEVLSENDIVIDVRNRVNRADNVEDTLAMLSDATDANDLERLNDALVHAYQLGLYGREIESAKKLRDKLGAQLDIINEMMADINIVGLRMSGKEGITESDIDIVDNAISRAKSQGLSSSVKQLRDAEKMAAKMKRQLVVHAELRAALTTNDFTKLKLAMDHANEHGVETELAQQVRAAVRTKDLAKRAAQKAAFEANISQVNEDITEEQLAKDREAKLSKASNPKYHFTKYSKIRPDEDFSRSVVFNKKKAIAEKLTYQTGVIPRSIILMEKSVSKVAVKIHQDILGYCGDKSSSQPASLALDILEKVIENHDLADEVYIQLFKHATKNTKLDSLTKTWHLLALAVGTFPPSAEFEPYALNFFNSHSLNTNPISNYARFCLRRVEGIMNTGITGFIPSSQEILSYKDRPPILATIELCDGTPLTSDLPITPDLNVGKVRDICAHFLGIKDSKIRDCFGIFVVDNTEKRKLKAAIEAARAYDDPAAATRAANASSIAHSPRPLSDTDYLGTVVVLMNRLKHDYTFVYKRKLYSSDIDVSSDDPLFRKLVFMQAHDEFVNSNVRCENEAETVFLSTMAVAATNDPFPSTADGMLDIDILSYIPKHLRYAKTDREWALLVINQSERVIHDPQDYLQDKLVDVLKRNPLFGSCFFYATRLMSEEPEVTSLPARIVCAINGQGLIILDEDSWAMIRHYPFSMINRWGGTARSFSFSISRHDDSASSVLNKDDGVKQKKLAGAKLGKSQKKLNNGTKIKSSFELVLQMAQAGDMSALLGDYVSYIMKRERTKGTTAATT